MAELGIGYISIVPEVSKVTPGIAKALDGTAPVAEKSGQTMGSRISAGMGKTLKAGAIGAGAAAGGVLAGAITNGMGRLTGIENAEAKLRGLGHSAEGVESIMDNALASVKGTAYGLEDAATVAASTVAAGIEPGKELERTLKVVGDAATIAGTDMASMGSIVNKVATSDMMQMDVANQLMDAGIPILQMVAEEMGVTADEARKMASDGKISFETFQNALEKGVGGAALESGNIFQGALANVGAALGRLGETGLKPFYELSTDAFGSASDGIDALTGKIAPLADSMSGWLQGTAVPAIKEFGGQLQELGKSSTVQNLVSGTVEGFQAIVAGAQAVAPSVQNIVSALGQASAALGVAGWSAFATTLQVAGSALQAIAGPLEAVTGFLSEHPGLVAAGVAAWAGFKTVPGIFEKLQTAVSPATSAIKNMGQGVKDIQGYYSATGREISTFGATMQYMGTSSSQTLQGLATGYSKAAGSMSPFINRHKEAAAAAKTNALESTSAFASIDFMVQQAGHSMAASTGSMIQSVKTLGSSIGGGLKGAVGGLVNALGGPLNVAIMGATALFTGLVQANQNVKAAQEEMARSTRDGAKAQLELQAAVAGTTGALDEQGLAAAARVAKGEMAELLAIGGQDFAWTQQFEMATNSLADFTSLVQPATAVQHIFTRQGVEETKSLADAYNALEDVARGMGFSVDEVNSVVAEGGPEYDQMIAQLRNSGDAGNLMADELEGARAKVESLVEAGRNMSPAMAEAAEAIGILADESAGANDKLGALEDIMQVMGLAPKDAEQAMMDAAAAVDELVESITEAEVPAETLGDALFDMNGKLSPTNESARMLATNLDEMRNELQNVAINGGDTQAAFENMQPALDALQEKFGLTDEQLNNLVNSYGLVPETIDTFINLEGASESTQELAAVAGALDGVPEGKAVNVGVISDEAIAHLEEIGFKTETLEDGSVEVTANTEEANGKLFDTIGQLTELNGMDATPTVFLDTAPLQLSAQHAQGLVDLLDIQNPTPEANMIIDKLLSGKNVSMHEIGILDAQSPTPTADLAKHLLDAGVKDSNGQLSQLAGRKATPTVDVNNEPARHGINAVKGWLGSIKDRVVNIFTRRRDSNAEGGMIGFAGGGVPGLAIGGPAGYRLPSAGRGTTEVDGFLGVDEQGMPIARVDAGEWVINRRRSNEFNDTLYAINSGSPMQIVRALLSDLRGEVAPQVAERTKGIGLQTFADGGRVSAGELLDFAKGLSVRGQKAARSLEGAAYAWGGVNWGDCSGAMAALARFAVGLDAFSARFATGNQREATSALGAKPGVGGPGTFTMGWFNGGPYGGHTSGTIHFDNGQKVNVEMGGGRGNGQVGGAAAPATHGQYSDHAHIELAPDISASVEEVDSDYDSSPFGRSNHGGSSRSSKGSGGSDKPSVSWSNAGRDKVDFGSASSTYDDVARRLGVQPRKEVSIATVTPPRTAGDDGDGDPLRVSSNEVEEQDVPDWGHDFFVHEIARQAKAKALSAEGARIGVATALVEAGNPLKMWANKAVPESLAFRHDAVGSDHDSVGLFQQRDNGAWGTVAQRMNAFESAGLFFNAMLKKFPDWESMEPGAVAQGVQVSAFPDRYAKVMEAALGMVKNTSLYDQGGWLPHGGMALNLSRKPEPILTNPQWNMLERSLGDIGSLARPVHKIANDVGKQADVTLKRSGSQLTGQVNSVLGGWLSGTEEVQEAEQGLVELRAQHAEDLIVLAEAEAALEAVRATGDPEEIARAEEELANARHNVSLHASELEAAERTLAATRLQVVGDMVGALADALDRAFAAVGGYVEEMTRLGGVVFETQQEVSKLQQEQIKLRLDSIKAANDLRIAEFDLERARWQGIVNVARAEGELSNARDGHLTMGATSVAGLGLALDKFYQDGMVGMEEFGAEWVANVTEIRAAEANLRAVKADTALADLEAQYNVLNASIAAAEATMMQAQSAEILSAQTEYLAKQTAVMHGMNNSEQTALNQRLQGKQKRTGGILGLLGGLIMGGIGVATMNPALIMGGIGMGAKGIADTATGSAILKNHDKEAADRAWDALPEDQKRAINVGSAAGAITGLAGVGMGAATGNAEWVTSGLDTGASVVESTMGSLREIQQARIDRIEAEHADRMTEINNRFDREALDLAMEQARLDADYHNQRAALLAEQDAAELQKAITEASSKREAEALVAAAEQAELRRAELVELARTTNEQLGQPMVLQIPRGTAWSDEQLREILGQLRDQHGKLLFRVEELESATQPSWSEVALSQR